MNIIDAVERDLRRAKEVIENYNKQFGLHCPKCHAVSFPDKKEISLKEPIATHKEPNRCPFCEKESKRTIAIATLPTSETGIQCVCSYPTCRKKFFATEVWIMKQNRYRYKQWMPKVLEIKKLSNGK